MSEKWTDEPIPRQPQISPRLYLAAHAPQYPRDWIPPSVGTKPDFDVDIEHWTDEQRKEWQDWWNLVHERIDFEWPLYWADRILEEVEK